ncbi:MAG TPA: ATP-binding cassette domain-containing protein [Steroidobacteraceae bacterium]|nr:ATP-binding cassette domain-containing protein [Steroidobacteraceae bacterium]HRX89448.1 ATP-binding cassette domain-containing protein [Steroidobacteraceae bacterium]
MMLLTLRDAQLAFGLTPLLDRAALTIESGERIGLIGRNGTGKSTLLQIFAERVSLDEGEVQRRSGLRVVLIEQEPELPDAADVYTSLLLRGAVDEIDDDRERTTVLAKLTASMQRFGVDPARAPATTSGGERKRAALALGFALEPDLLLLDEPTNHLDFDAVSTLEDAVLRGGTRVIITHDRYFLDRVATRIVELDRGILRSYPGNWSDYETRKAAELEAEQVANRRFDKFWAQEEVWIRKGIEARRTRNEGRVKRLERLRVERAARREQPGKVRLALDAGERSGKLVAELEGVSKFFGEHCVVRGLDLRVMRGDRLGLIGPNGAGKTTLIKLIVGALAPDSGSIRRGTNLQVAYFDQLREQLDPECTLAETVNPGSDWVDVGGGRRHISSYLADFLFPARRAQAPVRMLSGGERNRLLLARLFATPANLLVLDEPTNDLDIESLELLEQLLQDYAGTLLLVTHDRRFLDNVVTQSLVAEGNGRWQEYVGGYTDWIAQRDARASTTTSVSARPATASSAGTTAADKRRMSYKDRRELDALPGEIETLETEQRALAERMSSADYYQRTPAEMRADQDRVEALNRLLDDKLARWEVLESSAAKLDN